jgi:drug/metabolite transporter (DMT)-like permease
LLVATIWGVNIAIMKFAITEIDLFTFNAVRLTLSAVTLAVCVWFEQRNQQRNSLNNQPAASPSPAPSVLKKWLLIASFAITTGGFYQILFAVGMDRTTAGNTALIISSIPMWIAVLSFFVLREKLGLAWLGLIVTFIGTIIVTLQKGNVSLAFENLVGNGLILIAALAWSTGAIISRPLLKLISPIRLAFYATVGTLPVHYLMSFLMGSPDFDRIHEPAIMFCIFYSGLFSTGLAYAMWNYGVQQLGASHAAAYQNLVPLIALLAAWLSPLHEIITPIQLVGGFLIIFGLFVTRRLRTKVV